MGNQLGGMQQSYENGAKAKVQSLVEEGISKVGVEVDKEVQAYEKTVTQRESVIANKRMEVNNLKNNINATKQKNIQTETSNLNYQKQLDVSKSKINEKSQQLSEISNQFKQKQLDNQNYVESLTPKERSFVLQKALDVKNYEIIQLFKNAELDADFRNGDGISLVQTAISVEHHEIINKLKPLASEESYHPPKKIIENIDHLPLETNPINNLVLDHIEEVKDDVQATGENIDSNL